MDITIIPMNWIDRLLLFLLISLLPLAVIGTFVYTNRAGSQEDLKALDAEKFEQLVNQVKQTNQAALSVPTPKPFFLAQVAYASESAELRVKGTAPDSKASILVTTTVLPRNTTVAELDDDEYISGSRVESFSTQPQSDGQFEFVYEIEPGREEDIVEVRMEQDQSVNTIRFDLKDKKQLF